MTSENAAWTAAGGAEREDAGREQLPAARAESAAPSTAAAAEDVNELGMAALIGLLAQQRRSLDQAELTLSALVETYRNTRADHSAHGLVEVVAGADAVRRRFELVQYSAQHEVLAMSQADYEVSAPGESTAEAQAIRRGVEYRVVIERLMLDQPGTLEALRADLVRGQLCRVVDRVPSRLLIVDGNIAMLPLSDAVTRVASGAGIGDAEDEDEFEFEFKRRHASDAGPAGSAGANGSSKGADRGQPGAARRPGQSAGPGQRTEPAALLVRAPAVIRVVTGLFESVWERAVPIRATGSEPIVDEAASEPTALDLHILSQLMAGATDAAIAKQLGLGLRTVQRRVAHLMELASVTTRLQLGWAAARRGWLD
ncbi:MAG TPA: hypothetical protein VGM10_20970 [Actinocrinis sp.]